MSPPSITRRSNSTSSLENVTVTVSNKRIDRWFFLFIHLVFCVIILIIIYVRLGQFNVKHERILVVLNGTMQSDPVDCACQIIPNPRRNRTTRCLEVRVGLTESISNVFCPISSNDHEHNQWLTVQNRQNNQVNFNRTWIDYRRGFGDVIHRTNFWIGLENLHWLTNNYPCRLKIELTDWQNETRIGTYELFHIANQNNDYRIEIGGYNGNIDLTNKLDTFSRWHHNAPFSTYDHYPTEKIDCSQLHGGNGWWFHSGVDCAHVQLNGICATHTDGLVPLNTGIIWIGWKVDRHYSFQRVRMSIQPKLKRDHLQR